MNEYDPMALKAVCPRWRTNAIFYVPTEQHESRLRQSPMSRTMFRRPLDKRCIISASFRSKLRSF